MESALPRSSRSEAVTCSVSILTETVDPRAAERRRFNAVSLSFSELYGEWMVRLVESDIATSG